MKKLVMVLAVVALVAVVGCKKKKKPAPTPPPTPTATTPTTKTPTPTPTPTASGEYQGMDTVAGAGTVKGKVSWKGAKPALKPFTIAKDTAVCGKTKPSNRLVVGAGGGVQYAVVSLVGIKKGKKLDMGGTATLDQTSCVYTPHVQVVPKGAKLTVINSDPILHNVHAYLGTATEFNMGMPIKGQKIPKKLNKKGWVDLKCDAGHVWMNAFVKVVNHPYHAVTDANGNFTIKDVPPGTYKIKMWHEGWKVTKKTPEGRFEYDAPKKSVKSVTVAANGTATVNFELSE